MCQTKSPESEVRGGVRDAAQAVLYGVDGLMHEHVCSIKHLQTAQFKHLHQNHKNASLTKLLIEPSYVVKLYLLVGSSFLYLSLTGIDVVVVRYQRLCVFLLVF